MTLQEAYKIIEQATMTLREMGNHDTVISTAEEERLSNKLNFTNSYVREYIINHVDREDEILQLESLVDFIEGKFEDCVRDNEDLWPRLGFLKREELLSNHITQADFDFMRKKRWIE